MEAWVSSLTFPSFLAFSSPLGSLTVCGRVFGPSPGPDLHFSPLSFKPLTNHWLPASPPSPFSSSSSSRNVVFTSYSDS